MALSNAERQASYRRRQLSLRNEESNELSRNIQKILSELKSLREIVTTLRNYFPSNGSLPPDPLSSLTPSTPLPSLTERDSPHGGTLYAKDFLEFWEAYPHKIGKGAAAKAFKRAKPAGIPRQTILDGVRRYVACKPADKPWCNPATWLNQERWNDEYPAAKPNGHMPTYGRIRDPTEIMAEIEARDRAKEQHR